MSGCRWGLVGFALVAATTVPARAQTEPGAPEISVDGATVQTAPAPVTARPPAPPLPASPADTALERVLRSGCRDGLDQVRALRGDPSAPWVDTVERLCGNVLRTPAPATAATGETISERASANEGRGRLVLWSSLYGIWLGIAGDVLTDVNNVQSAVLLPDGGDGRWRWEHPW